MVFAIFCLLFLRFSYHKLIGLDPREMILGEVIKETNQKLKAKYHVNLASVGRSHKDLKIKSITIDFNRFLGPVSKEEGRQIIVDCVEEYIKAINQKESLRPFLFDYPFSEKDVVVMMTHWNKDKSMLSHPDIATICKFYSEIVYYTIEPGNIYKYQTETQETYEEAKSLVKKITPRD